MLFPIPFAVSADLRAKQQPRFDRTLYPSPSTLLTASFGQRLVVRWVDQSENIRQKLGKSRKNGANCCCVLQVIEYHLIRQGQNDIAPRLADLSAFFRENFVKIFTKSAWKHDIEKGNSNAR